MKKIITLLTLLICLRSSGQLFHETYLREDQFPGRFSFEGNMKAAVKWTDEDGENIVITTESGVHQGTGENKEVYGNAELYAYHFISKGGVFKQTWKMFDFIKECPVDIEAKFINNSFRLTDLDSNGVAEIWLMYKTVCHGDVSPCNMKIIMYQAGKKHAMRGRNKVEYAEGKFDGGEYSFDVAFNKSRPAFREFAKALWSSNIMQVWE